MWFRVDPAPGQDDRAPEGPANPLPAGQLQDREDNGRPRWAQPGPPAFEAAAQDHARRGIAPHVDDGALEAQEEIRQFQRHVNFLHFNPQPEPEFEPTFTRVIPLVLQNLAQHHPFTAMAALGFAGGLTVAGMGFVGLRVGRWMFASTRAGRRAAAAQGPANIAHLEDMERRMIGEINRIDAAHNVRLAQIAPFLFRQARAAEEPAQGEGIAEGINREIEAGRREGGIPPPPPRYVAEGVPPANQDQLPIGVVEQMRAEIEGLRVDSARLQQAVDRNTAETTRLAGLIEQLQRDPNDPADAQARAQTARSGPRATSIPSANNVNITGPILAQTRPITNVPPEDVPGPTLTPTPSVPRSSAVNEDESQTSARPAASAPPTDFSMSQIDACIGDIKRQYTEYTTAESDASNSPVANGEDVTGLHETETETEAGPVTSPHSPELLDKGKGVAEAAIGEEAEARADTDDGWSPIDMQEAIDASRRDAAGFRDTSALGAVDGEAGPSGWRGRRIPNIEASSQPDRQAAAPETREFARRPTRMSFCLLEEITEPVNNRWITMPIQLVESRHDEQAYNGFGFRYDQHERLVESYRVDAELFVSGDISLIKLDGTVWRCGLENGEYVIRERIN